VLCYTYYGLYITGGGSQQLRVHILDINYTDIIPLPAMQSIYVNSPIYKSVCVVCVTYQFYVFVFPRVQVTE